MATFKIKLDTSKQRKDGTYPVTLQVIHNKIVRRKTLFNIEEKYWDPDKIMVLKSHKDQVLLNGLISKEKRRVEGKIIEFEYKSIDYNAEDLMEDRGTSFQDAIQSYIKLCEKEISISAKEKYSNLYNKVQEFTNDKPIPVESIDHYWMDSFKSFLAKYKTINSKETVNRLLKFAKTVLRREGVTDPKVINYKTPTGSGSKPSLSREEFERIRDLRLPSGQWIEKARDIFVLSVYLRGARIGDVLQLTKDNMSGDRLIYKTQKNRKQFNIKLIDEAQEIIDRYKESDPIYLLPALRMKPSNASTNPKFRKHIQSITAVINKNLKVLAEMADIQKNLSTHVARHTFASFTIDKGMDLKTIQDLLGHSSPKITEQYLRQVKRAQELDDAVDGLF